jgi:hypothetical protein
MEFKFGCMAAPRRDLFLPGRLKFETGGVNAAVEFQNQGRLIVLGGIVHEQLEPLGMMDRAAIRFND